MGTTPVTNQPVTNATAPPVQATATAMSINGDQHRNKMILFVFIFVMIVIVGYFYFYKKNHVAGSNDYDFMD